MRPWLPLALLSLSCLASRPLSAQFPVPKEALTAPALGYLNPASKPVYDAAEQHWIKSTKGIMALMKAAEEQRLHKMSPQQFVETDAANSNLRTHARWLEHMGEPAGFDFKNRTFLVNRIYETLASAYRQTPAAAAFNDKVVREFGANLQRRMAQYQDADEMVARGEFEKAETKVEQIMSQWLLRTSLLEPAIEGKYFVGFNNAVTKYRQAMEVKRRREAVASLAAFRDQTMPKVQSLLSGTAQVVRSVTQGGKSEIAGKQYDGPESFDQLARIWKQAHWQLVQAEGIEMSRCSVMSRNDSDELQQIRAAHRKLTSDMALALAELITSESARATPELHARYTDAAAKLTVNTTEKIAQRLDTALLQLGEDAKIDGLAPLSDAMNELLRWRRIAAQARGKRLRSQHPYVTDRLLPSTRSRGPQLGLFPERSGSDMPEILDCAPMVLHLAKAQGTKASAAHVVPGTGQWHDSRLVDRVYLTTPPAWDVSSSVAQLKDDLLVTEQLPPLTLGGSVAVQSAESGAFAYCGGTIDRMIVRSLLQLKATLPIQSWNRFPLGDLPDDQPENFLNQAVLHLTVTPEWLQHEYFVIPATRPPQS